MFGITARWSVRRSFGCPHARGFHRPASAIIARISTVLFVFAAVPASAAWKGVSVKFFPDGKRVIETYANGAVRISSAPDGEEIHRFEASSVSVNAAAISHDGARAATASSDGVVTIWSTSDWSKTLSLGVGKPVTDVVFSPDDKVIASASYPDQTIRLWDAATGGKLFEIKAHDKRINKIVFSRDGKLLASASEDQSAKLWDARDGREIATFALTGTSDPARTIAISADSKVLAAGNGFRTYAWDIASKALKFTASGGFYALAFSPDGKRLALGERNGIVLVDAATGKFQSSYAPEINGLGGNIISADVSADWQWFALLSDRDGWLYVNRIAEADILQAKVDEEGAAEDAPRRDPLCLGAPCKDAKLGSRDGCITVSNSTDKPIFVVADFGVKKGDSFYVRPGETATFQRLNACAGLINDFKSIDMTFANDADVPAQARKPP